jgi:fatty acid desaturase
LPIFDNRDGNLRLLTRNLSQGTGFDRKETKRMLWTIFVILLILWLLGFIGFHVLGAYIHILLVIALVILVFAIIGGRRTVI